MRTPRWPAPLAVALAVLGLLAWIASSAAWDVLGDHIPPAVQWIVIPVGFLASGLAWWLRNLRRESRQDRRPVPALPPRVELVGREREVDTGVHLLRRARFLVVQGPRNIGTSAVALEVARRTAPDGGTPLYVDLRAREAESTESADRVRFRVLRALGRDGARSAEDAAEHVRVRLHEKPTVLVLDNARAADQVDWLPRPVPEGSAIVVAGDVPAAADVQDLPVGRLSAAAGLALLRRDLPAARLPDDGDPALDRLAEGWLKSPAVVGRIRRWLQQHPSADAGTLLAELEGGRPPDTDQTEVLRGVLAQLTAGLSDDALDLLELLPHVPTTYLPVRAAAALLDRAEPRTERALEELARATLLDAQGGGRYRVPREARRLARGRWAARRRAAARARRAAAAGEAAAAAAAALEERAPLPLDGSGPVRAVAAETWFREVDLELPALLRAATRDGPRPRSAARLREIADALDLWFRRDGRPQERAAAAAAARDAARSLRDPAGEQSALLRLAAVAREQGRLDDSGELLRRARDETAGPAAVARWGTGWAAHLLDAGDTGGARGELEANLRRRPRRDEVGRVTDRVGLGAVLLAQGDLDAAEGRLLEAAALGSRAGDAAGFARAQELLGVLAARRGRPDQAVGTWRDLVALYEQLHDEDGQARCLVHLGTLLAPGDPEAARWALDRSLELRDGPGLGVALAHLGLAELAERAGDAADADRHRAEGLRALGPWAGRLDPPRDVALIRSRLNSEE